MRIVLLLFIPSLVFVAGIGAITRCSETERRTFRDGCLKDGHSVEDCERIFR